MLRWLVPRVISVVAVLVGLNLALDGGSKVAEHRWVIVTGKVETCYAGGPPAERECAVSWETADGPGSATVVLEAAEVTDARTVALRVHGDMTVANSELGSVWLEGGTTLLGLAVIAGAVVLLYRSPHRPYERGQAGVVRASRKRAPRRDRRNRRAGR